MRQARRLLASKHPAYFLARYVHRNEKGASLDLSRCPALMPFLLDDSRHKMAMKCVQIGVTELLLVSVFAKALRGWYVLYSFPNIELKNAMVANRVDKSIRRVDYYRYNVQEIGADADSRSLKHFGRGIVNFVGTNSQTAFLSQAADIYVCDEMDKSNQENIKMAPDRLDASPHKYIWKVSNPSFTKFGIHAEYLKSDQKTWHITCVHCGDEQPLDWFKNVVEKTGEHQYRLYDSGWDPRCGRDIAVVCRKCGKSLDRLGSGRWVAGNPGSDISGYHMSQLFSPTKAISELWLQFQAGLSDPTEMQRLYNSGLGLPYDAVGDSLTAALLEAKAMGDYLMPSVSSGCTMGVDVGGLLHAKISEYTEDGARRSIYIGAVALWDDLSSLIERYGVLVCVVDSKPELHKAREFQEKHPGVVWLCDYATNEKLDFWTVDDQLCTVRVDRTAACDGMVAELIKGNDRIPKDFRSLDDGEYIAQMEAPKRKLLAEHTAEGKPKRPRYVWDEGGKKDHHFHAAVYDYLAHLLRDMVGAKEANVWWLK